MNWIDDKLKEYYAWMRNNTLVKEDKLTGWVAISTPFVGLFNDNIEIYAKKSNGKILLSDDGETLENLALSGVEISKSPKRKQYLNYILQNYGVSLSGCNELCIESTDSDFPRQKHNLISAISEISDMSTMAKHTVASMFKEDVRNYLTEQDVIYTPQFIARGTTGLEITFDFQIAGREREIVIKAFNAITQSQVERFLFGWDDIKRAREDQIKKEVHGIAIINNSTTEPNPELISAILSRSASPILWDQRHTPDSVGLLRVN